MALSPDSEITRLLHAWGDGDQTALDQLMPLVYDELRRRAHYQMKNEKAGHTLQTTGLVNEVWLRLSNGRQFKFNDRAHFLKVCSRTMRFILVDYARRKKFEKIDLEEVEELPVSQAISPEELIALDEALTELAEFAPRRAQVVEMRSFGGAAFKEIGQALGISEDVAQYDWKIALNWLRWKLTGETPDGD